MYTSVLYPENLVLSGASFADQKVRCGGNFLLRICMHTSYRLCLDDEDENLDDFPR